MFPNPLYDHEEHSDRTITFLAPEDRAVVEPEDEARRGADVPGGDRVKREVGGADVLGVGRETGGADVPGGGLVNRVAGGVWQHQARADPGGEGPILYPYSPSDIFCFLCP